MASRFRRAFWKPWNWSTRRWILALSISVLLAPFVTRWICLWQVSDVTLPFDPCDVIAEEIPSEDDAIARYALALTLFDQRPLKLEVVEESFGTFNDVEGALRAATRQANPTWDVRLDHWLRSKSMVLDEFQIASEMERSSGPSLETADDTTAVNIHQNLRRLVVLAEAEAVRFERMGDLQVAWGWHLANLRCARHCMMPRFVICYLIGVGVRTYTYVGIARWAEHSELTNEQLQIARNELSIDLAEHVPILDLLKANYLCFRNMMNRENGPNHLFPKWEMAKPEEPLVIAAKKAVIWTIGQPEIVLRLARQALLNNSYQIARPVHLRQKAYLSKQEIVFEVDSKRHWFSAQLDPIELRQLLDIYLQRIPSLDGYLLGGVSLDKTNRQTAARRSCLDVVLAVHQYQRQNGQFPESIQQLVPDFLEVVPVDPMNLVGAQLKYRLDDNGVAIVWSIGHNEIDDDGNIDSDGSLDTGYRIRVKRRSETPPASQETSKIDEGANRAQ